MLVVHIAEDVVFSRGVNCDIDLRDCAQTVTNMAPNPDRVVVLFLLASFDFSPSVVGVTFGIEHTASLVDYGMCLRDWFELPTGRWPESGSGTALVSASTPLDPVRDRLFSLYWFAVYAEDGAYFAVTDHPSQPTAFGDESLPSVLDEVEGFGWAGFGLNGYNPCLDGVPIGACCVPNGSCVVTTESACRVQGGIYLGDDEVCGAFSCTGPCCSDNECFEETQSGCEDIGGEWLERPGTPCGQVSCLRENVTWGVLKHHHRY
jgi:hypothetical protein